MKKQILNYKTMTLRERIVNSMFVAIVMLSITYCAILFLLVFSVIERKQAISSVKNLVSKLSAVESAYANEVANINETVLSQKGFVRLDGTTLTVRKDPIAGYTVLYER